MVNVILKQGSTGEIRKALAYFLKKEDTVVADIKLLPSLDKNALPSRVDLELVLHDQKSEMDMCVKTDAFSCGFNGTGPQDLLKVLRMAGITPELLSDDEVLSNRNAVSKRHFSSTHIEYGEMKEI